MFWPSFNGALAEGATQHRIMVNTSLAIIGSVISAICVSRMHYNGKLDMEVVLNATLAGGVAIGSNCDLVTKPSSAMFIGMCGGILSAVGFTRIGPYLSEKIGLQDTCGVHSLHGMPGVFGALVSVFVLSGLEGKGFPKDYFEITKTPEEEGGVAGTYGDQGLANLYAILVTLAIASAAGAIGGFICSFSIFQPAHALFRDEDHFCEVLEQQPEHW